MENHSHTRSLTIGIKTLALGAAAFSLTQTMAQDTATGGLMPLNLSEAPAEAVAGESDDATVTISQTQSDEVAELQLLEPLVLIGSEENVYQLPGSGYFIDEKELRKFNQLSINRVLQKVPGVYVREETGFGNFPNISIRGGDGTRSENVTIMEDGIPTAPAPYSAPAAYYSPNASRMSGIEVLKGSSQIQYGPHTTGGVINYLSTPIPESRQFRASTSFGSYASTINQISYGDVISGDIGRFGFLAEFAHKASDGFRTIDSAPGYGGSDNTGFTLHEPMIKVFFEPATSLDQRIEFKYGFTDFEADESYIGLTEADIAASPYRRYAGTFLDNFQSQQHRSYVKWIVNTDQGINIETTAYMNDFSRNWYKINTVNGNAIHRVLADPATFSNDLAVLRMQAPGQMNIRANNRDYKSVGYQTNIRYELQTGELDHEFLLGGRFHKDEARRFQRDDTINVTANGAAPTVTPGIPGSGGNRLEEASAFSTWFKDTISFRKLQVSPGVRYEYVEYDYTDYLSDPTNTVSRQGSASTDIFAPGVGLNYELTDNLALFGGVFKGISAPDPRSHIRNGVNWEESIGYETGLRYRSGAFYGELAGFFTDYDNITASDAGLGGSNSSNAGEAEVKGIEMLARYSFFADEDIRVPVFFSGTYTEATLDNALSAGGGDDIYAGGVPGADIPYVPNFQATAGLGIESDDWDASLAATWTSDSHGTARNLNQPADSSRQGTIEGGWIVDFTYGYNLSRNLRLLGGIQNIFDNQMITSRIPDGPRTAAPRMFFVGLDFTYGD